MINYDKYKIRQALTTEDIFDLLLDFGGEPTHSQTGLISKTICHNHPADTSSRKLYYYDNTGLFQCYTGCEEPSFDIFQLIIKVAHIQWNRDFDLNDAVRWVAQKFGFTGDKVIDNPEEELDDWKYLVNYERIQDIEIKTQTIVLKEYDKSILERFNYDVKISPWLKEGISQNAIEAAHIGYYPGGDQITIPHYDKDGRFIGLRGRAICAQEAELYGKYRPLRINKIIYNHPLGMNLYNLNKSKNNIAKIKKAIIFESEKSSLLYYSYFGEECDISVACCGSNVSSFQMNLLIDSGAEEIIIAFDRQFQEIGDNEFKHLKRNLLKIREKYKNLVNISFIFDKKMITGYKASPIDEGPEKFLQLFKERIVL